MRLDMVEEGIHTYIHREKSWSSPREGVGHSLLVEKNNERGLHMYVQYTGLGSLKHGEFRPNGSSSLYYICTYVCR